MIENEKQYGNTKSFIDKFTSKIKRMEEKGNVRGLHPLLFKAQLDGLRSMRDDLQGQIDEYDGRGGARQEIYSSEAFEIILSSLIRARISLGMGEAELAGMVGLEERQIVEYESTGYARAEAGQIMAIIGALKDRADAAAPSPA